MCSGSWSFCSMTNAPSHFRPGLSFGLFFLFFFCFYMALSMPTVLWNDESRYGFHLLDRYFEADPFFMIEDLTTSKPSLRTPHHHPFITLYTHPIGVGVSYLLDRFGALAPDARTRWRYQTLITLSITNGFLSAAVAVIFLCFSLLNGHPRKAILFTLIAGFSNATLVFSIVPDHYCISLFLLCLTYFTFFWCIKNTRTAIPAWVALSVICFSITSFNVLQPGLLFLLVLFNQRSRVSRSELTRKFATYAALFLMVCSVLFFLRNEFQSNQKAFTYEIAHDDIFEDYVGFTGIQNPVGFASTMLLQTIVAPLVAPIPRHDFFRYPKKQDLNTSLLYFTYAKWSFTPLGWISVVLIALIVMLRLRDRLRQGPTSPSIQSVAMLGCLFINLLFHSFYGWGPQMIFRGRIDIFLYSLHWLFPLCYLLFPLTNKRTSRMLLLWLFFLTAALNNLSVIKYTYGVVLQSNLAETEDDPRKP